MRRKQQLQSKLLLMSVHLENLKVVIDKSQFMNYHPKNLHDAAHRNQRMQNYHHGGQQIIQFMPMVMELLLLLAVQNKLWPLLDSEHFHNNIITKSCVD